MPDRFTTEIRSKIMSKIRGKNTKPEILLRKSLFNLGYRYGLNHRFKTLNFKPDLVLVSRKTCIFVDGCFWHGCPRCYRTPKSNQGYWIQKINRNKERDQEQNRFLRKNGWKVIRIWEHEINENLEKTLSKVNSKLQDET